MKRILKKILTQKPEAATNYRGATVNPLEPWKRNAIAAFLGSAIGLYVGQYFPDLYFAAISPYIPHIPQLDQLAPATASLKPKPEYP